jgi:hypothetical protein
MLLVCRLGWPPDTYIQYVFEHISFGRPFKSGKVVGMRRNVIRIDKRKPEIKKSIGYYLGIRSYGNGTLVMFDSVIFH